MLAPLIPLAATSLSPLVRAVGDQVGSAFSFLEQLRTGASNSEALAPVSPETGTLESKLSASLQQFHDQVIRRLAAAGVDVSLPIELSLNAQGQLAVTSAHPDLLRIEQELNQGGEFSAAFSQLAQQHAQVRYPLVGPLTPPQIDESFAIELSASTISVK